MIYDSMKLFLIGYSTSGYDALGKGLVRPLFTTRDRLLHSTAHSFDTLCLRRDYDFFGIFDRYLTMETDLYSDRATNHLWYFCSCPN
jgi:hypothetical protein